MIDSMLTCYCYSAIVAAAREEIKLGVRRQIGIAMPPEQAVAGVLDSVYDELDADGLGEG